MKKTLRVLKTGLACCCMLMGAALCAQPQFEWAKGIAGGVEFGHSNGITIKADPAGNVYTFGDFVNVVDFDPGSGITTLDANDGNGSRFLSKFNAVGDFVWVKQMHLNGGGQYQVAFEADATGNIYISGQIYGTMDLDPGPGVQNFTATGNQDGCLLKLNAGGEYVWARQWGAIGRTVTGGIVTLDKNGFIYLGGRFKGAADFDPGPGTSTLIPIGNFDVYISKFDTAGNFIWARSIGGDESDQVSAIGVDVTGSVYTAGYFSEIADFDPGPATHYLASISGKDIFLSKLDSSGNFSWAKAIGTGSDNANLNGLVLDGSCDIYITGRIQDSTDFDPGLGNFYLTANLGCYISKLDSSGNFSWAKLIAEVGNGNAIATDVSGNVFIGGDFVGINDFNPDQVQIHNLDAASGNCFITKFDKLGDFVWAKNMGNGSMRGLTVDSMGGNIYSTGSFIGNNIDFDPGQSIFPLSVAGASSGFGIFIHKMSCPVVINEITATGCNSYDFFGQTLTQSGIYAYTFTNSAAGCDSIIRLTLTVPLIDITVAENEGTLSAGTGATAYQWIDCANGNAAISGETGQSFTPAEDGSYAVIITQDGCSDTSDCYSVEVLNIHELGAGNRVQVYPNPTSGKLTIRTGKALHHAAINLVNVIGQRVMELTNINGTVFTLDIAGYPPGIYFAEIVEAGKHVMIRIMKE